MTSPPVEDVPSRRLVEQRVHVRVIEYLELAGSFEEQQEYERVVRTEEMQQQVDQTAKVSLRSIMVM
jgi:hypothetical protein